MLLLLAYNVVTTGELLHPAYDYLYEVEYRPRPELFHPDWGIEDPRYIPQNTGIMLAPLPRATAAGRSRLCDAEVTGAARCSTGTARSCGLTHSP